MKTAQDFTEAYQQALPAIWHFVSSRIPSQDEAQDVTSEVFSRAWQSWVRYDPARGSASAWVCGIAQRTVADWWRRQQSENVEWEQAAGNEDDLPAWEEQFMDANSREPEQALLQQEFVADLRRGLLKLNGRERDAVALRFGASLRAEEIAEILDLSIGATKMTIHRAILKLRALLASDTQTSSVVANAESVEFSELLDEAIADTLARRRPQLADAILSRVLQCLAVLHQPSVPSELPGRVVACVTCEAEKAKETKQTKQGGPIRLALARIGLFVPGVTRAATVPACVLCGLGPLTVAPLTALGLFGPALALHISLFLLGPLNLVLLWRSFRYHGEMRGLVLAAIGVVLIGVHMSTHTLGIDNNTDISSVLFVYSTIWIGFALLVIGSWIDWRARRGLIFRLRTAFAP